MQVIDVPINQINPAKYNPRTITDKELAGLMESIKKFGFVEPLIVNKRTNTLCGGHQRLKAAEKLGHKTVPITHVDLSEAEEKALNVALNSHTIQGKFDTEVLHALLDEIKVEMPELSVSLNMDDLAVDMKIDFNPDETKEGLTDDDAVPEVKEDPKVKLGEVWLLGEHRVMCGDSTNKEMVDVLMNGQKADMVLTDPPYGNLSFMGARKEVAAKTVEYKEYANNEDFCFKPVWEIISEWPCPKVIWGGNYFANFLPITTSWIVWDKRAGEHSFFSDCELAWSSTGKTARVFSIKWQGMIREGESGKRVHPTQKPVALSEKIIKEEQGVKLVVDLFLGSGSSLVACEKIGARCYGMEMDTHYFGVIIKRWQDFTGQKAFRESDNKMWDELQ
jgi:DNA modification methylase